jgi:hypothetical protein
MLRFKATKVSAFLAGFVLSFAGSAFDIASKRRLVSFTFDSPSVFPFVGMFFIATVLIFVIGPQMISIERIPYTGIPKNRSAWMSMFQIWGRMAVWFLGAVVGVFSLMPFK